MLGMLFTGSANTILMKTQDNTWSNGTVFNHPFFQCAVMFLGEFMCLGFYGIKLLKQKHDLKNKLKQRQATNG